MISKALTFAGAAFFLQTAFSQTPSIEFDVASMKRSPETGADSISINLGTVRNGQVTLSNATLAECLMYAYGLSSGDQVSGPDWIKSRAVRYDIQAKAAPDNSMERLLIMLRLLLTQRLKIKMHHEDKVLPYLALVAVKNGPKLERSETDARNPASFGHIAAPHLDMPRLASLLSRFERKLIIDKTGLDGFFKMDFTWTPESATPESEAGPTLYTALQEQLGLKLESRRGPIDILVIDSADQIPVAN